MQLFMANKGLMLNVSLSEIKNMQPIEVYLFVEHIKTLSKEMEKIKTDGI